MPCHHSPNCKSEEEHLYKLRYFDYPKAPSMFGDDDYGNRLTKGEIMYEIRRIEKRLNVAPIQK